MTTFAVIVLTALACSCGLTRLMIRLAPAVGLVDCPDGRRKLHARPTPLGGGIAVLLAMVAGLLAAFFLPDSSNRVRAALWENGWEILGFLAACGVLCFLGIVDDFKVLRGRQKLIGQAMAGLILIASNLTIQHVSVFGWEINLGLLAIPFTLFWLLGSINALNLIDGIDGLASTVGIVLCLTIAAMAEMTGQVEDAAISLALAGSLIGFLLFNYPPARIFLGDAGSMVIGLTCGVLAIRTALKGPATVALAAPMAVWAIPIFDSATAILRRKLTGRSIYTTDTGHLHHCLMRRGWTNTGTLGVIALLCGLTAIGALVSVYLRNEMFAFLSAGSVVATLVAFRVFGHVEFELLSHRLMDTGMSLVTPLSQDVSNADRPSSVRVREHQVWGKVWTLLMDSAAGCSLSSIRLHVCSPNLEQNQHAFWEQTGDIAAVDHWRLQLPLFAQGRLVARLELTGISTGESAGERIRRLGALLQTLEAKLADELEIGSSGETAAIHRPGSARDFPSRPKSLEHRPASLSVPEV